MRVNLCKGKDRIEGEVGETQSVVEGILDQENSFARRRPRYTVARSAPD